MDGSLVPDGGRHVVLSTDWPDGSENLGSVQVGLHAALRLGGCAPAPRSPFSASTSCSRRCGCMGSHLTGHGMRPRASGVCPENRNVLLGGLFDCGRAGSPCFTWPLHRIPRTLHMSVQDAAGITCWTTDGWDWTVGTIGSGRGYGQAGIAAPIVWYSTKITTVQRR